LFFKVARPSILEVYLPIALGAVVPGSDCQAINLELTQQLCEPLLCDRSAMLPFRPRFLRVGGKAFDQGPGGSVVEGRGIKEHLDVLEQSHPSRSHVGRPGDLLGGAARTHTGPDAVGYGKHHVPITGSPVDEIWGLLW